MSIYHFQQIYNQSIDNRVLYVYSNIQKLSIGLLRPGCHHPIDKRGVIYANYAVRIIPNTISQVEQKILCATFLDAILRFYDDPINTAAFERWRMEERRKTHGQENGG